jgi:hypothetical protein
MKARRSKTIVVDADVARSAGITEHPRSKACRGVLDAMLKYCHKLAWTSDIAEEWKRHQSSYAIQWRAAMTARKKIRKLENVQDDDLRNQMSESAMTIDEINAILKDIHLIEAALRSDSIIISCDQRMQKLLTEAAQTTAAIRLICWSDPCRELDECVNWVASGASVEMSRRFGSGVKI